MNDISASSCGCQSRNRTVGNIYHHLNEADAPLAMAYVPEQRWSTTYDLCKALETGTIFPCLNKPFCGKGGMCR